MCGIAGILSQDPNGLPFAPEEILDAMLRLQEHRGPDDFGKVLLPYPESLHLSLGHRRLSVIDLSTSGHQPMTNSDKSFWITSNNEIYNYQAIRKELSSRYHFKSQSDTEVLLYAFQNWGIQALDRLRGMFAFGIWNVERKSMILARDRLGVKPLYYYHDSKNLIFASEVRSLLATGLIQRKIDPQGLFQYLSFGRLQAPHTMIEGIRELPPGHYCEWVNGKLEEKPYWELDKCRESGITPSIESAQKAIESAVQSRMVSDVPVGAFLSGGIDSSAVVALMTKSNPETQTLSVVFGEKEFDESKYARISANKSNSRHNEFQIQDMELRDSLPDFLNSMDQPTVDGVNVFMVSRQAKELGWKVALSGLGGDELFGGYDSFKLLPQLNKIASLPKCIRKIASCLLKSLLLIPQIQSDKYSKIKDLLDSDYKGTQAWYLFRSLFTDSDLKSLFHDSTLFYKESSLHYENTALIQDKIKGWDLFDQISYLEITQYMTPTLLKDADVMGMCNGLEIRVPFTDHLLVESILSFPEKFKMDGNTPKPLLVKAMGDDIPKEIISRKKMGFTLPFETWMKGSLREEVESVLMTPVAPLSEFLNEKGVQAVWHRFLEGKTSWSRPWAIYVLKKWANQHLL